MSGIPFLDSMWSSSSKTECIYDVFLNFRGEDTGKTFVPHLYAALSYAGINTFIDDKLHRGTELGPELVRAIKRSRISIVVFSTNYASSRRCLNELVKIMECKRSDSQVVVPVYYLVDPSEVRRQSGAFGKAFAQTCLLEGTHDVSNSWKTALTEVANLLGWVVRTFGAESKLVKQIVEDICRKLDTGLLSIPEFPVGLESRVQEVIEFINAQSRRGCVVGIWGMGGLGKTTIAKFIYNQIRWRFWRRSFIGNIREVCEKDGRGCIDLQQQLLSDLLEAKIKIDDISTGITLIEKRLCEEEAVVVLDDVTEFEQLKALCGNRKWIGRGSVLIITTRDVRLLNILQDDHTVHICRIKEMDVNESLELFSWHAFRQARPREDFIKLSMGVVAYCAGLPLALEVLGSYLFDRTKGEWGSVLSKLEKIPNDQVQEKLKISYDGLDYDEKKIFLDICFFFIGKDRADVTEILKGCGLHPEIGITILVERSLIKLEKNNKLKMHDLIRDMGREIVRQSSEEKPKKRSRLWAHQEVLDVLSKQTGTNTIEGLTLKLQRNSGLHFNTKAFKKMKELRLLQLDHVQLDGDYRYLNKNLRWVCWKGFPLKHIPGNLYQGNVISIELKYSNIRQVWKEPQLLEKLKILNLSHSSNLIRTPDFSKLPNLVKLILKDCPSLSEVHQSIGGLTSLLVINLMNCTSLSNLPRTIYKLKSLQTLILSGCSKIDKLEEDIEQMESLTSLIAKDANVKEMPHSIVRLKNIGYISLCGHEGLAHDIFPSLIWSWISPTANLRSSTQQFGRMSTSLISMDILDNNLGDLLPMLRGLSKLRCVLVQFNSKFQLTQDLRIIMDALCDVKFTELERTSSQISVNAIESYLIGMGSYDQVINMLCKSISEGLRTNDSSGFSLPGDNYPYWLAYIGQGRSVHFQLPEDSDCGMKGMALCVVYSSTCKDMVVECLTGVLIVNYTKCTIQIYKRDTITSFNDEDWQGIISNLRPSDNVEIFVAFGHGLTVLKTAIYLIYGQSIAVKREQSPKVDTQPSEMTSIPLTKFATSSSSFLRPKPQWIYNVFINFWGEDICKNFVSHLHSALLQAEVNTFLDYECLVKEMQLEELMLAIEGSQIAIVVLTKTYTESTWCLDELAKIIEIHETYGQRVVLVFYEIDPSDVCDLKGDFGKALKAAAQKRFSGEQLESALSRWSHALTKAANFPGWDVRNYRNEAELVKEIVNNVVNKLEYEVLPITKFPVGLESHVQKVIGFIENQSIRVCITGIWGMGGSGKTTTAKAIYNRFHHRFVDRSFIKDIRQICQKERRGHVRLQEQLLLDILKTKVKIQSIGKGTAMIKGRLCGKRLFIVLDDVNEFDQLKCLCGNRQWFGQGTVIIITTRDLQLLNLLKVDYVYKMEEMDENESLELFSWHAFREPKPREDFNELARNVVAYCGGLPLALEVLGSYLFEKAKEVWETELSKLEMAPNNQVQETLRISFDDLHDQMEKDIFLDVCCFFIGKNRAYVTEILNGCGLHADIGITVLIECSLLKVEKNTKLGMHPLLRDMGREIIRENSRKEPGKCSRLWFHEDVIEVLTKNTATEAIEGLSLKLNLSNMDFKADAFKEMRSLRLLRLDQVDLTGDYGYLSKQLRWIYWKGFPLKYIPSNFHLEGVIVIDLKHSNLRLVWKEPQDLEWLKILNLSHSKYLTETPDFSKLPNLEKLILKDCPRLCKVHKSIGDLHNLILINLKDCKSLGNLPRRAYKLKSVKTLILVGCSKVDKLEEDIVQMESLITLIAKITAVKQVPFSIVRSKSIGYVSLCGYEGSSHNVFPSIILSWMSPTMNPLSRIRSFSDTSSSLVSMDMQNNNLGDLAPILSSLSNLRSILVQCDTKSVEFQVLKQLTILDDVYGVNFTGSEITSYTSQISKHLSSYLIGIGSYQAVFNTLINSISEGLATSESCDVFLPGDNYPYWLAHMGEGNSVYFTVPEDCRIKGMTLCVVYSSTPENTATECLISVLMVNYTKCTIQIHKRETVISFNEADWQGIISHFAPGDKVEIFVIFGNQLAIKKTAVYLTCDESIDMEMEPSPE